MASISRDEYVALRAAEMEEKDLQAIVERALGEAGWTFYHPYDSRRSNPGFPDIVAVRASRVIWRELKDMTGRLSVYQKQWKLALETADADYAVWRPDQWHSGLILEDINRWRREAE